MLALLTALVLSQGRGLEPRLPPQENPNVKLRVCNGRCASSGPQGSFGEALTFARASAGTCPNDDGSIQPLLSGYACIPSEVGPGSTINFLVNSNIIGGTGWSAATSGGACSTPTITTQTADVTAPDGSNNATKIVFTACSGLNGVEIGPWETINPSNNFMGSLAMVPSLFARTLSGTTTFNLYNTQNTTQGSFVTCTATPTWSRCSASAQLMPGQASWEFGFDGRNIFSGSTALPAGTVYVWGGQDETAQAASPAPLVVTTTSGAGEGNFTGYGVRMRQSTTNVAQFYNALATSPWVCTNITASCPTVTNNTTDVTAPDGSSTATKLVFPAVASTQASVQTQQPGTTSSGSTYTWSIYLRTLSGTAITYLTARGASNHSSSALNLTSSWQRFSFTQAIDSTTEAFDIGFDAAGGLTNTTSGATFYAWGAQIEIHSVAYDVCPTAGASATCNAETLTTAATNYNVAALGCASLDVINDVGVNNANDRLIQGHSDNGALLLSPAGGGGVGISKSSGTNVASCGSGQFTTPGRHHISGWWNSSGSGSAQCCVDGVCGSVGTGYDGTIINNEGIDLCTYGTGTNDANATCSNLVIGSSQYACP